MRALLGPIAAAALLVPSLWTTNAAAQHHHEEDGPRFRGGVALEGGGWFISGYSAGLVGVEGRLGAQINNMIGVYAQPEFSLGAGKVAGVAGITGTAGASALVDFTFLNQIFVAAGGGGGYIGNAPGAMVHLRAGGYPVFTHGAHSGRRKGLMIGLDMRIYVISGYGAVMSPMLGIGYEAY
jgi:hypothetical protein